LKKLRFLAFAFLATSNVAMAEAGYAGECNVLIQTIRSTETWKQNGLPLSQIKTIIDENLLKIKAGHLATPDERDQWHSMETRIFQGEKLDSQYVAESVGRFCKPPYTTTEYGATANENRSSDKPDRAMVCRQKGIVFMMAAENRNVGRSPQEAYQIIGGGYFHKGAQDAGLTKDFVKQAINTVYFDPGFINAGGMPLAQQMEGYCLRDGKPQFEPLK
jgi:hypothetical protein